MNRNQLCWCKVDTVNRLQGIEIMFGNEEERNGEQYFGKSVQRVTR